MSNGEEVNNLNVDDSAELPDVLEDIDEREALSFIIPEIDYETQMIAISSALQQMEKAKDRTAKRIYALEERIRNSRGWQSERAEMEWMDRVHDYTYQDAAYSMTAVGMLAPFTESLFHQAFLGIRAQLQPDPIPFADHTRWQQPSEYQWDCHYFRKDGRRHKQLEAGIRQLSEATGMHVYLPAELDSYLEALFIYRNKMFHCGFEWPINERQRFSKTLEGKNWPDEWFSSATSGGEPWIFYLTKNFTNGFYDVLEEVFAGMGKFCIEVLIPMIRARRQESDSIE